MPVDSDGTVVPTDKDADIGHTVHMETILGADGVERTFDLGGKEPHGDGPIYMLPSHDESCCKAGEYQEQACTETHTGGLGARNLNTVE